MHSISNLNLIVLKWHNIHVLSNIKYVEIYSKTWSSSLYLAEAYLESYQMSKIEFFLSLQLSLLTYFRYKAAS